METNQLCSLFNSNIKHRKNEWTNKLEKNVREKLRVHFSMVADVLFNERNQYYMRGATFTFVQEFYKYQPFFKLKNPYIEFNNSSRLDHL